MSLVRCTCVGRLEPNDETGRTQFSVEVVDPECDYIIHRLEVS